MEWVLDWLYTGLLRAQLGRDVREHVELKIL